MIYTRFDLPRPIVVPERKNIPVFVIKNNLKLLNRQHFAVWKLEGISFKFFCDKKGIERYKSTLHCLDRIDSVIENEVNEAMREAEERDENPTNQNEANESFIKCLKTAYHKIIEKLNLFKNK